MFISIKTADILLLLLFLFICCGFFLQVGFREGILGRVDDSGDPAASSQLQSGFDAGYELNFRLHKEFSSLKTRLELSRETLLKNDKEKSESSKILGGYLKGLAGWQGGMESSVSEAKEKEASVESLEGSIKTKEDEFRELRLKIEADLDGRDFW